MASVSFTLTHQQSTEWTHSNVFPQRGQVFVIAFNRLDNSGGFEIRPNRFGDLQSPQQEYQLFKQHCTGNDARFKRAEQQAVFGVTVDGAVIHIVFHITDIHLACRGIHSKVIELVQLS